MSIRVANAPCSWGVLEFEAHAPGATTTRRCSTSLPRPATRAPSSATGASCPRNLRFCTTAPTPLAGADRRVRSCRALRSQRSSSRPGDSDPYRSAHAGRRISRRLHRACGSVAGQHRANLAGGTSDGGRWSQSRPEGRLRPRLQRHRPDGLPVRRAANRLSSPLRILRGDS